MQQSDIFCVESVNDSAKFGTKNEIWQKTGWLYAQLMEIQLIFLARQFLNREAADLSTDLLKGPKKSSFHFLSFDTLHLHNKVVKQKRK